jgi:large subunit ribosomal protein L9e
MRDVLKTEELDIPEGVTVAIKARIITVTGPRGTLTKNVQHINMDIKLAKGKKNKVLLAVWQGGRKHVACLRTIKSLINNMVIGVTKVLCVVRFNYISCFDAVRRVSFIKCVLYMPTFL